MISKHSREQPHYTDRQLESICRQIMCNVGKAQPHHVHQLALRFLQLLESTRCARWQPQHPLNMN